jgi:hypothetical protein
MSEDVPTLIGSSLVNPITNCYPEIQDCYCQLAKVYGQGGMLQFVEGISSKEWDEVLCELDYSGHDNNTSENQIVCAFALLRLCFDEGREIDRLFYYSMSSMIHKRVVIPGCNMIFQIDKGVSTGHAFTSLITTMCAYGTLATAILRVLNNSENQFDYEKDYYLQSSKINNAGDDVNMRINVCLTELVYKDVIHNSGHTIDDLRNCGYHDSFNSDSRVTFLKKKFNLYSWNLCELLTNLLHPTVSETKFGNRADNLEVLMFQSPVDTFVNNVMTCVIVAYILCGRGYHQADMLRAQRDGRTMSVYTLFDICKYDIGWHNPNFIDKLLDLDYGYFNGIFTENSDPRYGSYTPCGTSDINIDAFIKYKLRIYKRKFRTKLAWFLRNIPFKMLRKKNTLTVYDFLKVFTKPKSCTITYTKLSKHMNKFRGLAQTYI